MGGICLPSLELNAAIYTRYIDKCFDYCFIFGVAQGLESAGVWPGLSRRRVGEEPKDDVLLLAGGLAPLVGPVLDLLFLGVGDVPAVGLAALLVLAQPLVALVQVGSPAVGVAGDASVLAQLAAGDGLEVGAEPDDRFVVIKSVCFVIKVAAVS